MSITSLPLVSVLRERMQWNQARQSVLAENVSNADTPGFRPKDLQAFSLGSSRDVAASTVAMLRTNSSHLAGSGSAEAGSRPARRFETRPSGNAVSLDDEMIKVADNQSEFQLASSLYQKSLALLRSAAGARGA